MDPLNAGPGGSSQHTAEAQVQTCTQSSQPSEGRAGPDALGRGPQRPEAGEDEGNDQSEPVSPEQNIMYSTGGVMANRFGELRQSAPSVAPSAKQRPNMAPAENLRGQRRPTGTFQSPTSQEQRGSNLPRVVDKRNNDVQDVLDLVVAKKAKEPEGILAPAITTKRKDASKQRNAKAKLQDVRRSKAFAYPTSKINIGGEDDRNLMENSFGKRSPYSQLRFQRRSGTFAVRENKLYLEQAWRRLPEHERPPDYDGVMALLKGSNETAIPQNPSKAKRAGSVQQEVASQLRSLVGGRTQAGKKRESLDLRQIKRKKGERYASIDDIGIWDRSQNTSGTVDFNHHQTQPTPAHLASGAQIQVLGDEDMDGKQEFEQKSDECVTALERELRKQKLDEQLIQIEVNPPEENGAGEGKEEAPPEGSNKDYVARYQALGVFKDPGELADWSYPLNMTGMDHKSRRQHLNRFRKNKLQARAFFQSTGDTMRLKEYKGVPFVRPSSEMDATAAQTTGRVFDERTRTAALQPVQQTPDRAVERIARLTQRDAGKHTPMNRTGHWFPHRHEFESAESHRGRYKMGGPKFSVPSARNMQNSTATNCSMFNKTNAPDVRRNAVTPYGGIDSCSYDLDLFKSKTGAAISDSQTDDLKNQINELKALKNRSKRNQKENTANKSIEVNLELLDNTNIALESTGDDLQTAQPGKKGGDIFSESFANLEVIKSCDGLGPPSKNKLQMQKNLRAIVSQFESTGPTLSRTNETSKREKELITRRLRSHLHEQEYFLDSERDRQFSSALISGRTTESKTSPRLVAKSIQKTPRSATASQEGKQEDVLQIEGDAQQVDQHDFSFFIHKQSLFVSGLHMLNNSLIKQMDASVYSFQEALLMKMSQNTRELEQFLQSVSRQKELLQKGLDNLTAEHSKVMYEYSQLQAQQGTFTKIINESKKNEEDFDKMFAAAKEFLNSQSLAGFMEQLEEADGQNMPEEQQQLQNQIKRLLKLARAAPGSDEEASGAQESSVARLEADFLSFSGVTDKLDEVISQMNLKPSALGASQQIELQESAFNTFVQQLESRMSFAQIQTSYKLWARIRKIQTFADAEAQVGAADLNAKVQQDLKSYREQVEAQHLEIEGLTDALERKKVELEAQAKKVAQAMAAQRALKLEVERLEDCEHHCKEEIEKLLGEREQHEKRVSRLYEEIKLTKQATLLAVEKQRTDNVSNMTPLLAPSHLNSEGRASGQNASKTGLTDDKELVVEGSPGAGSPAKKNNYPSDSDLSSDDDYGSAYETRKARGQTSNQATERDRSRGDSSPLQDSRPSGTALKVRKQESSASPSVKSPGQPVKKQPTARRAPKKEPSALQTTEIVHESKAQLEQPSMPFFDEDQVMAAKLQGNNAVQRVSKNIGTGNRNSSLELNERSYDRADTEQTLHATGGANNNSQHVSSSAAFKVTTHIPDYMNPKFVYPKHQKSSKCMVSIGVQTDQQMLFEYIMAFLKVVEDRIKDGTIAPDIMQDSSKTELENLQERQRIMEKSRAKLKELQQILGRIGSLRNGRGGDIFFKSLAKTFQANPVIPALPLGQLSDAVDKWQSEAILNGDIFGSPISPHQPRNENTEHTPQRYIVKTKLASSAGGGYQSSVSKKVDGAQALPFNFAARPFNHGKMPNDIRDAANRDQIFK